MLGNRNCLFRHLEEDFVQYIFGFLRDFGIHPFIVDFDLLFTL